MSVDVADDYPMVTKFLERIDSNRRIPPTRFEREIIQMRAELQSLRAIKDAYVDLLERA